jgi:hypothetical protein
MPTAVTAFVHGQLKRSSVWAIVAFLFVQTFFAICRFVFFFENPFAWNQLGFRALFFSLLSYRLFQSVFFESVDTAVAFVREIAEFVFMTTVLSYAMTQMLFEGGAGLDGKGSTEGPFLLSWLVPIISISLTIPLRVRNRLLPSSSSPPLMQQLSSLFTLSTVKAYVLKILRHSLLTTFHVLGLVLIVDIAKALELLVLWRHDWATVASFGYFLVDSSILRLAGVVALVIAFTVNVTL